MLQHLHIHSDRNENFSLLIAQTEQLIQSESDDIANYANISALIMQSIEGLNWVGFYLLKDGELVLGPFQGKVACTRIKIGSGVCGTTIATQKIHNVADVHQFEGHIACDSASNSELVIPIIVHGHPIGVLDIDSYHFNHFDIVAQEAFQHIVRLIELKLENKAEV